MMEDIVIGATLLIAYIVPLATILLFGTWLLERKN